MKTQANPREKALRRGRDSFTLIEMLIVVGVLALLIALLSPAILKSMMIAERRKLENEVKVLEAAITEYWSDHKRWPLGEGGNKKDPYKDGMKTRGAEGRETPTGIIRFGGRNENDSTDPKAYKNYPNYIVFNELYKATYNGVPESKTYIDITVHTTHDPSLGKDPVYPVYASMPLKDVLKTSVSHGQESPILCYWAKVFLCPHCDKFHRLDAESCGNDKCQYRKEKGFAYTFKSADKSNRTRRALFPFIVTFDFYNETVQVSTEY